MKKKIFIRIFIIYGAVLLLSVIFIESYITNIIRNNYITNLINNLSTQSHLISRNVAFQRNTKLDTLCRELKKATGSRITVIYHDGTVLGDSDHDSSLMENHADRPEVVQAGISQTGWAIRFSDTIKEEFLYASEKITENGKLKGFIRVALPLKKVNESINTLRLKINLTVIIIFILTGGILIWQTERVRKFLKHITEYSGALAGGLFGRRIYLKDSGEFTQLSENLNSMASALQASIEKSKEETNRLNVVLKNIPDALLLINSEGMIEISNNAARELFNNPDMEERPYIEIIRSPEFMSLVDNVTKNQMTGSAELFIEAPLEKYLSVRVSPLFYRAGELEGTVAIFHDMTHIRKLEQMRKDFVANVSHEIKTPVTSIQGFAETLLDGAIHDTENAEKFLLTIKSQSERLNRLVEDLLTLSKIELGVTKIHKTEISIPEIVDKITDSLSVQASEKKIILNKSIQSGEIIKADRDKLMQILTNLLDNAIKFTEHGSIETGSSEDSSGRYLYVKDTGTGIPSRYLPRLGERFFRVDPSRSRDLGGTGLGLAIVKHLVKAHGWKMKIESAAGKGTTVKIYYS